LKKLIQQFCCAQARLKICYKNFDKFPEIFLDKTNKRKNTTMFKHLRFHLIASLIISLVLLSGCTTLVQDPVSRVAEGDGQITEHCEGSEVVDDSSIAVLPVPIAAFFVPHADLNEIEADKFLNKCGDSRKLVNRKVKVNRSGCVPAGLTRIITLGIWQWCPASVSWEADVQQAKTQSK
jgi:hypothetical protein